MAAHSLRRNGKDYEGRVSLTAHVILPASVPYGSNVDTGETSVALADMITVLFV